MIRKAALQIGVPALLAFMAWNAYLAVNHLKQMQTSAVLTLENAKLQVVISSVLKDLTDMETGQRGYLLTGDASYLQPYSEAKNRIESDFSVLRARLVERTASERSLESQLEALAKSKQAEMEHSISLRQQGYRHRAFMLVNSNEGAQYMDKARELLSSLGEAATGSFTKFDLERNAALSKALKETIIANSLLLALTACLFGLVRYHGRALEQETAQSRQELAVRDLQLAKLTSALSNQARFKTSAIEANARLLLQNYGGFLPRQGHEYAEQIKEASAQMELLRQDLVGNTNSYSDEKAA
ncbi:MAG: CHASE3 domain-containing protein [Candidatus Sulfotelmatobacter sp.]